MPVNIQVAETTACAAIPAAHRYGNLFYHPHWLQLLIDHYGYRLWKTTDEEGGYVIFAQARGMLGPKLISLPFSDYTIPQVKPALLPLHLRALQQHFPNCPILFKTTDLYASPKELAFLGKPVGKACLHRVDVTTAVRTQMSYSFLRGVRKAQRNGLVAETSISEESLMFFYALYYRLRTEKLKLIPQPFSFFQRVYEQFIKKGEGFIYEVKKDGEVLASAIVLREGDGLYYKWGCSAPDRLYMRPNNLLFHDLLQLAMSMGCKFLDLGLSDLDETRGLIRFKKSLGGKPFAIYSWCLCPEGYPLELESKFKGMVNQLAGLVVEHKLQPAQTQSFSQALYPLFV